MGAQVVGSYMCWSIQYLLELHKCLNACKDPVTTIEEL